MGICDKRNYLDFQWEQLRLQLASLLYSIAMKSIQFNKVEFHEENSMSECLE